MQKSEMTAEDAANIIKLLEQNGIEVYVDGGWGVDALLGEQIRKHDDLDIAVPHKFVPKLRELLEARGYIDVPRDDTRDCNFVLGDDNGRMVDIHSYTFDENGTHIFGVAYEPHHLTGSGTINGYPVKCVPPDIMVEFHTGYDVDENDYLDTKALCEQFNIPLPNIYNKFEIGGQYDCIERSVIINKLAEALKPLPFIYAFWLEGADATNTTDEYSDIDFWVDFEDEYEEQAIEAVENALSEISKIDYKYIMRHSHPKICQRIYHLAGTSKYLMLDFCWQLHSRPNDEYAYHQNDSVEAAKVIFDKNNLLQTKPPRVWEFSEENQQQLEEARYRRTQHCRAEKYVQRGQYLEAYAYYNRYVLEPIIVLLRLIHTPAYTDYYLVHISQHIPATEKERLEYFARISSLDDISEKIPVAGAWFDELMEVLNEKIRNIPV